MPKHKKKFKCEKEFDKNLNDNDDSLSVVSCTATSSIYQHDSPFDQQIDDNIETKLDVSIDGIQSKSYKDREEALKHLIELFKKSCFCNYLIDKKFTLTESLLKCLKRGNLSEQLLALKAIMLTFIQFGCTTPSEEFLRLIYDTLLAFIKNEQLEHDLRDSCIKTLSLGLYITDLTDETLLFMNILEDIYGTGKLNASCLSGALSSWALLLTMVPINYTNKIVLKSLERFEELLENTTDVDFRVCIGETIALLYELTSNRRDLNSSLKHFDSDNLIEIINNLIKESSKSTSKKDRRTQHSNFRDILKIIEDYNKSCGDDASVIDSDPAEFEDSMLSEKDYESKEFVKVSSQYLYLDNWVRKKQYKAFSDLLGTGMNAHLIENECLRDIFELGPPILISNGAQYDKQNKLSKMQRVSRNKEEFRYRTKDLNKKRENKSIKISDQFSFDDN